MPDAGGLSGALQTRVAGVPAWAIGIAAIGGVLLARRFGLFGAPAPSRSPAAPSPANQGIPPGFVPASEVGLPGNAPPAAPAAPAGGQIVTHSIWGAGANVWVFATPADSSLIGIVPDGTTLATPGPAVPGGQHVANGTTSAFWQPVIWNGSTSYIWGPEAAASSPAAATGVGGRGGGSRTAVVMHHGHPGLKQRVRYPHYHVVGRGGPGSILEIANRAGVHPARLMSLNSHLREQGWTARPGQIVRIA